MKLSLINQVGPKKKKFLGKFLENLNSASGIPTTRKKTFDFRTQKEVHYRTALTTYYRLYISEFRNIKMHDFRLLQNRGNPTYVFEPSVHRKWSLLLKVFWVNVTIVDLVTFPEEIINKYLHFCAAHGNRKECLIYR